MVSSDLGWGLILYGEEEEKVMAASTDPVISKIWKVSLSSTGDSRAVLVSKVLCFIINFPVQMKEEVELDDTYAVLKERIFFVFDIVTV